MQIANTLLRKTSLYTPLLRLILGGALIAVRFTLSRSP